MIHSMMAHEVRKTERNSVCNIKELSDSDKSVLYYISGSILHALSKKPSVNNAIQCLIASKPEVEESIRTMTKARDRGALKEPTACFFHVVECLEAALRKEVNIEALSASSLNTRKLQEAVLMDTAVQHYWGSLQISNSSLLEIIAKYFLRIRGYALDKVVNEQHQKTQKDNRKSASLRQKLKGPKSSLHRF